MGGMDKSRGDVFQGRSNIPSCSMPEQHKIPRPRRFPLIFELSTTSTKTTTPLHSTKHIQHGQGYRYRLGEYSRGQRSTSLPTRSLLPVITADIRRVRPTRVSVSGRTSESRSSPTTKETEPPLPMSLSTTLSD